MTAISLALSPILVALSFIILKKIRQYQSLGTNTDIDKLFNCRTLLDCLPVRSCPYAHLTVFNILLTLLDLKPMDSGRVDVAFDISRQKSESVQWSILCESDTTMTRSYISQKVSTVLALWNFGGLS